MILGWSYPREPTLPDDSGDDQLLPHLHTTNGDATQRDGVLGRQDEAWRYGTGHLDTKRRAQYVLFNMFGLADESWRGYEHCRPICFVGRNGNHRRRRVWSTRQHPTGLGP